MNGNTDGDNSDSGDGSACVTNSDASSSSLLASIAGQNAESQPLTLDVAALQADLSNLPGNCAESQPVTINSGATVTEVIIGVRIMPPIEVEPLSMKSLR